MKLWQQLQKVILLKFQLIFIVELARQLFSNLHINLHNVQYRPLTIQLVYKLIQIYWALSL